jgi:hypothetical protein
MHPSNASQLPNQDVGKDRVSIQYPKGYVKSRLSIDPRTPTVARLSVSSNHGSESRATILAQAV